MKKNYIKLFIVIIILASSPALFTCSPSGGTATVTINLGFNHDASKRTVIDRILRFFATESLAQPPADVESVVVRVTGSGMGTIEYTYTQIDSTIIVYVPSGPERVFVVEGKNAAGKTLYIGNSSPIDLGSGESVDLVINMRSAWGKIYVANWGSNNVSVIDGSTDSLITTISVGTNPFGVGVNQETKRIYVTNNNDDTVTVIDGSNNTVIGGPITVCTSCNPIGVRTNPITNKIYVGTQYNSDNVVVIDGVTLGTTDIPVSDCYPYGVGVNSDTNKIYVALWCGAVTIINGSTDSEIDYIDLGLTDPYGVGVNPITNRIYVSRNGDDSVSVINGSTDTIITTIPIGIEPYGVGVNPNTNRIYVANYAGNSVSVIDGSTNLVITTITVGIGTNPIGVSVNQKTNRIYVTNEGSNTVSVIDGSTNSVINTISVGTNPSFLDILF